MQKKRIGSVVKRMEKLEQRVRDLEWDNWKSRSELLQWDNWYDVNFGTNIMHCNVPLMYIHGRYRLSGGSGLLLASLSDAPLTTHEYIVSIRILRIDHT